LYALSTCDGGLSAICIQQSVNLLTEHGSLMW